VPLITNTDATSAARARGEKAIYMFTHQAEEGAGSDLI